jgi:hypothetical protein
MKEHIMIQSMTSSSLAWPLLALFLLNMGCSSPAVISKVLYQDVNSLIRLDVTYRAGEQEHSHPAILTPAEVTVVLQAIEVEQASSFPFGRSGGSDHRAKQALTNEQIQMLAPLISQALSRATPLEEVVFYWHTPYKGRIREITSGSVYLQANEVHLVFANYRQHSTGEAEAKRVKADPRVVLDEPWYDLTPGVFGRVENMKEWSDFIGPHPTHLVLAMPSHIHAIKHEQETTHYENEMSRSDERSLLDKLEFLRELHEKGLLSEEEFQEEKKEVLEDL